MRMIVIVLQDDGDVGIVPSDGITPGLGLAACKGAADYYQRAVIEAEVQQRLREREEQKSEAPALDG